MKKRKLIMTNKGWDELAKPKFKRPKKYQYPGKDKDEFDKVFTTKTKKDLEKALTIKIPDYVPEKFVPETPTFLSRLEAATVRYEQAIKEMIETLKGN
jgi:hypothetical protein